jgi:hypothetical protein
VIKSGKMRRTGHVQARGTEIHTEILWGNLKERGYKEDLGAVERIILKWILNRTQWRRLDLSG